MKKILIKIFNPLALKLGYVKRNNPKRILNKDSLIDNCCNNLKQMGFEAKHIIDVGANKGGWTREMLNHFPNAYYSLFEPQKKLHDYMKDLLQNSNVECYELGVSNKEGDLKFTIVDRDDSCSFRYTEKEANEKGFNQITIPVITLNEFFKDSNKPFPDLIKIDAEGLDLEVLEGATKFLGKTEVIMVEAAIVCKAFNNDIQTMINKMDDYGYTLFDITDLNRPFSLKVLWLVELVFIKKGSRLDNYKYL